MHQRIKFPWTHAFFGPPLPTDLVPASPGTRGVAENGSKAEDPRDDIGENRLNLWKVSISFANIRPRKYFLTCLLARITFLSS